MFLLCSARLDYLSCSGMFFRTLLFFASFFKVKARLGSPPRGHQAYFPDGSFT